MAETPCERASAASQSVGRAGSNRREMSIGSLILVVGGGGTSRRRISSSRVREWARVLQAAHWPGPFHYRQPAEWPLGARTLSAAEHRFLAKQYSLTLRAILWAANLLIGSMFVLVQVTFCYNLVFKVGANLLSL